MPHSEPVNIPKYLYRYRPLDNDNLLYTERILLHNELYFTSPANVNDPFDCVVSLEFDAPDTEYLQYFISLSKINQPHLGANEHKNWAEDIIKSGVHKDSEFNQKILSDLQSGINSIGLLCLTEIDNSILMWSHYANSHTGICLEFANDDSEPFMGRSQKVKYLPFYTKAHVLHDDFSAQVNRILLSKSDCWSYEAEWRIIDHNTGHGIKFFEPSILKSVILGCKISDANEQLILKWVSERKFPLNVYKAKQSPDGFSIIIER